MLILCETQRAEITIASSNLTPLFSSNIPEGDCRIDSTKSLTVELSYKDIKKTYKCPATTMMQVIKGVEDQAQIRVTTFLNNDAEQLTFEHVDERYLRILGIIADARLASDVSETGLYNDFLVSVPAVNLNLIHQLLSRKFLFLIADNITNEITIGCIANMNYTTVVEDVVKSEKILLVFKYNDSSQDGVISRYSISQMSNIPQVGEHINNYTILPMMEQFFSIEQCVVFLYDYSTNKIYRCLVENSIITQIIN